MNGINRHVGTGRIRQTYKTWHLSVKWYRTPKRLFRAWQLSVLSKGLVNVKELKVLHASQAMSLHATSLIYADAYPFTHHTIDRSICLHYVMRSRGKRTTLQATVAHSALCCSLAPWTRVVRIKRYGVTCEWVSISINWDTSHAMTFCLGRV